MIVTIDGPAGAGKSSAARLLAARLGFQFLDTGAMYRAVTWQCLQKQVDLGDRKAVAAVARQMALRLEGDRIYVDGVDVTDAIRSSDVTQASQFAAGNEDVRKHLTELQRQLAAGRDSVTEGRDQGTLAFPDAECKFYLTADPRKRAQRRQRDLARQGETVPLDEILAQQSRRDERDTQRSFGALKPATDAIDVDTSSLELVEVVDRLEQLVRGRIARSG